MSTLFYIPSAHLRLNRETTSKFFDTKIFIKVVVPNLIASLDSQLHMSSLCVVIVLESWQHFVDLTSANMDRVGHSRFSTNDIFLDTGFGQS